MFLNFRKKNGFTLIEILVVIFIFSIIFLGILGAYQLGLRVVELSKNKVIATSIANGELEKIRNLPYESIGVQGSFPDGILESVSFISQNNKEYEVKRRVDYIVNSADGIHYPEDDCPNDYKKVEIKVSWVGSFGQGGLIFLTNISPKNLAQECAEAGGILSVSVFDAYGLMVDFPLIEVRDSLSGEILKTATPANGKHYFSLLPETYKIIISKDGYSVEETYATGDIYNGRVVVSPEKPHPIILEGFVTEISLSIDKESSMTIESRGVKDLGYPEINNISFNLRGSKKIGIDSEEEPIYKYYQSHTTGSSAEVSISNLEWDSYFLSVNNPSLNLIGIESPFEIETDQPISLQPDSDLGVRLILKSENSLLITAQNIETNEPIFSAEIRLYNEEAEYDEKQYTSGKGQVYFIPLESLNYDLEINAPGYSFFSKNIFVSGDKTDIIKLEQVE